MARGYLDISKIAMDISKETCITGGWHYLEMSKNEPVYIPNITRRMAELGLTKTELARAIGKQPDYISNLLGGKQSTPSIEIAIRIARALRMDLHSLFEGTKKISLGITLTGAALGEGAMWEENTDGAVAAVPLDLFGEDLIKVVIESRSFEPLYSKGDVVMGSRTAGAHLHNLIGQDCIIKCVTSERMIAHLVKGSSRNRFVVRPIGSRDKSPSTEVSIEWAAPIKLILKKAI